MSVLEHVGAESPECVSAFTNLLSDPDSLIRANAIKGLTRCGEMAKSAAPSVLAMLEDEDSLCRIYSLDYFTQVIPASEFQQFRPAIERAVADAVVRPHAERVLREKTIKTQF